jgi:hypothetical protein
MRIFVDYHLRHLVNNVAMHIDTHDYIRMEITVFRVASKINLRPSNLQLMP